MIRKLYNSINTVFAIDAIKVAIMLSFFPALYILFSINSYQYCIISFILVVLFNNVGMDAGTHRYLSHRSFKLSLPLQYTVLLFSTLTTVAFLKVQVGTHRMHHKYVDTDLDPQNSRIVGWLGLYCNMFVNKQGVSDQFKFFIRDSLRDKVVEFYDKNYVAVLLGYVLLLLLIDPYLVLFAYIVPAGYCLHTLGIVNCLIHRWGYKNYHDRAGDSRNSVALAILTLGANGWHNNHHANASDWQHGKKKWEIDPTSLIIRMIKNDQ